MGVVRRYQCEFIDGGVQMKRYIQGEERSQVTLLPECLEDYIAEYNTVRVVDVFVDELGVWTGV
jgi:hypothetical protein